jgi:hypothetical protein
MQIENKSLIQLLVQVCSLPLAEEYTQTMFVETAVLEICFCCLKTDQTLHDDSEFHLHFQIYNLSNFGSDFRAYSQRRP